MPVKFDTKNNPFCTSSEKLCLKGEIFNNHWFGHSVMTPVNAGLFQIIKYMKEGGEENNDKFYM